MFIIELADSLDIMLRLTVAYPVVCKCFATARRMGMMGWRCSMKAGYLSLQAVPAATQKLMTLDAMTLMCALRQGRLPLSSSWKQTKWDLSAYSSVEGNLF